MLICKDLKFEYEKGKPVLKGIDLSLKDGESVGLIGANGAGKSTLLRCLVGLLRGSGEIALDEIPMEKKNLAEIRRRIGFGFQEPEHQLFMPTVWEDLLFGPLNYGCAREEAETRAEEALAKLEVSYLKDKANHKLSGGEKRMAALASLLTLEPSVLLLDEPGNALDPLNRRRLIRTLNGLSQSKIIATHDLDMVLSCCSRVILLSEGQIRADGPAEEILGNKALLESCGLELPLSLAGRS